MFRLTVLIENFSYCGLPCEHGLSLYLEYRGRAWLLDTGTSGAFTANADALGLDLARVEGVVLSHGHDDHAGGLPAFFARNRRAKVYARPFAPGGVPPGHRRPGKAPRRGGPGAVLGTQRSTVFDLSDGPRTLAPRPRTFCPTPYPTSSPWVAETAEGLVVLNSCCPRRGGGDCRGRAGALPPGSRWPPWWGDSTWWAPYGMGSLGRDPEEVRAPWPAGSPAPWE